MAFRLSSFLGGVAKGATDLIEEREKENALQIKESIKNMYHNYAEYRKETDKKKEEIRETVGSLRSFKFADGPLDEKELIALASDLPTAKSIAEEFRKNPEKLEGLSKSFIKATGNIPEGMTFNDYVNQYGKVAKMDATEFEQAAAGKQDGFLNKMVYGNNVTKIRNAAAKYGVSAEELYNVGAAKGSKSFPALLEVDYAKLKDKPDFKKIESDAQVAMLTARQTGTEEDQAKAAANLGHITFIKEYGDKKDKTQNIIEAEYANKVIKLQKEGKPKEAAEMEAELKRWQKLVANPATAAKTDADKISQANLITAASRTMVSTMSNYLPPGSFITTSNPDGTTNIEVKDLASSDKAAKGYVAGREVLIKEMTTNGKPRSEMHKNALLSAGVQFDKDGNAVNPKVNYGGEAPAPAAAATQTPRPRGGPMARQTAPVDTAKARSEANAAIANGADRAAVAARFKQQTGQDL
tara:strand:- start:1546 stop:2949 length:1404 start_codon:yes stop_codon:yes gene_type:complete